MATTMFETVVSSRIRADVLISGISTNGGLGLPFPIYRKANEWTNATINALIFMGGLWAVFPGRTAMVGNQATGALYANPATPSFAWF
jgi:hypothetical protein